MINIIKRNYFIIIFLFLLPACVYKKAYRNQVAKQVDIPVFIQMPENVLVFENLSPLFYKELFNHYNRLGYYMLNKDEGAFVLKTKIKNRFPEEKSISPDLILYNVKINIEVLCQLFDENKKLLAQKSFLFSRLICNPKSPILNSSFIEFEHKKLMEHAVPKIEQYFRCYFLK